MDLWIRSQDRMTLLNYSRVTVEPMIKGYNEEDKGYMFIGDHYYNLGEYKTKERALEVLDEIQKIIGWLQDDMENVTIGDMKSLKGCFDDCVYEMPKD